MSVLFVLILSLISISFVQPGPPSTIPPVICQYQGTNLQGPPFEVKDVPEGCNVVMFDAYFLNVDPPPADVDAMKALKATGKSVYMYYMFGDKPDQSNLGSMVLDLPNLEERIKPMTTFVKNNQIDGVILGCIRIFPGSSIKDYASIVNDLVGKIKKCVPKIKVGISISGGDGPNYSNQMLFNFSVTNENVDLYAIDLATAGLVCLANTTALGGRMPIISPYEDTVPLKALCDFVSGSHMDLAKVVCNFFLVASRLDASGSETTETYSNYCRRNPKEIWCVDSIQIFHEQVSFIKKVFKGIMLSFVNLDDMDNTCGCGKFPVTNAYIDAMAGNPIKCCDKIS